MWCLSSYPQPLDAFDLVPPHDASSEELWLLNRNWLPVHLPMRMQEVLGVVAHRLRQPVLYILVGIAHLLNILSF